MTMQPRTALITGASSGIGAAIALAFAARGHRIVLGARRVDRLEKVAAAARQLGATTHTGSLDVTDADSIDRFFAEAEDAVGAADVLINNAGCSRPAALHEYDLQWLRTEVDTNFLGPILVTRRGLRPMVAAERGGDIVFIGSDASRQPRPFQTLYGAAKAGIENLADGLARELEGTGIRVTKVRIGPTVSEFGAAWDLAEFGQLVERWRKFGLRDARLLGQLMPTEAVAQAVIDVVEKPPGIWVATIEVQPTAARIR